MNIDIDKANSIIDRIGQVWEVLKECQTELESLKKELESIAFDISNN